MGSCSQSTTRTPLLLAHSSTSSYTLRAIDYLFGLPGETAVSRNPIVPVEQRDIEFYDDQITVVMLKMPDHDIPQPYAVLRPICKAVGVDWSSQRKRILDDPVLSRYVEFVVLDTTNSVGSPNRLCMHVDFLNGWLFKINPNRVKAELRETVIHYQEHCYRILARAFRSDSIERRAVLEQVEAIAMATAQIARQQIEQGDRVDAIEVTIDKARSAYVDLAREITTLRERVLPSQPVTPEQAENIKERVHEVAGLLAQIPGVVPRRNPYASIWAEVHRTFGVPNYRELSIGQYDQVIRFLDRWFEEMSRLVEADSE